MKQTWNQNATCRWHKPYEPQGAVVSISRVFPISSTGRENLASIFLNMPDRAETVPFIPQHSAIYLKELGATGVSLPEVGLGTYLYQGSSELLRRGIELGATFIDTAELYENEEVVGRAIKGIRERVFIATKTHHFKYEDVLNSAELSLKRLDIDTIDLYQLHHPNAAVPIEETMGAMEELVKQGKVRFVGLSNFTVPEFEQAQAALSKVKLASNQMRYSIVDRSMEVEMLPYCDKNRVTLLAYSPLGHSFQNILAADSQGVLEDLARDTGKTKAQVALNWCLCKTGVVVIPKTESSEHMAENCQSSGWRLNGEQIARLDKGVKFRRRGRLEVVLRRLVRRTAQRLGAFKGD